MKIESLPTSKIYNALMEACGNDADIMLEEVEGKVAGQVTSAKFEKLSPSERQDLIWDGLDRTLTRLERARISFIATYTQEEAAQP